MAETREWGNPKCGAIALNGGHRCTRDAGHYAEHINDDTKHLWRECVAEPAQPEPDATEGR